MSKGQFHFHSYFYFHNPPPSSTRTNVTRLVSLSLLLSITFFNKDECHKVNITISIFVILTVIVSSDWLFVQVPLPLYDILALDEENLTVTVEPMVTVSIKL